MTQDENGIENVVCIKNYWIIFIAFLLFWCDCNNTDKWDFDSTYSIKVNKVIFFIYLVLFLNKKNDIFWSQYCLINSARWELPRYSCYAIVLCHTKSNQASLMSPTLFNLRYSAHLGTQLSAKYIATWVKGFIKISHSLCGLFSSDNDMAVKIFLFCIHSTI